MILNYGSVLLHRITAGQHLFSCVRLISPTLRSALAKLAAGLIYWELRIGDKFLPRQTNATATVC